MIASLVALSAENMRARRSFCLSAFAFSAARSKLSSAKHRDDLFAPPPMTCQQGTAARQSSCPT
jgi:hypothetical protein